jgi:hypothetical protein
MVDAVARAPFRHGPRRPQSWPLWAHTIPYPGGKVNKNDMPTMWTRFDEIASGKVRVE